MQLDASVINQAVLPDFRFNFGQETQIFNAARTRVLQRYDMKSTGFAKYGLEDWTQLDRSQLPAPALGDNTKAAYRQWWDKTAITQARNSEDLYFPTHIDTYIKAERRYLIDHFDKAKPAENRWAMAPLVEQILSQPDEVWFDQDKETKTTYLKNYNDRTYAVVTISNTVTTWFPVLDTKLDTNRRGILLKK